MASLRVKWETRLVADDVPLSPAGIERQNLSFLASGGANGPIPLRNSGAKECGEGCSQQAVWGILEIDSYPSTFWGDNFASNQVS